MSIVATGLDYPSKKLPNQRQLGALLSRLRLHLPKEIDGDGGSGTGGLQKDPVAKARRLPRQTEYPRMGSRAGDAGLENGVSVRFFDAMRLPRAERSSSFNRLARAPRAGRVSSVRAAILLAIGLQGGTGGVMRAQILDQTFNPGANSAVCALALQPDDKLIVGGLFTRIAGVARSYLARLNANGALDSAFAGAVSGSVYALALQADGKVLVGGTFSSVSGVSRGRLARLNANGTLDPTFAPEVGAGIVRAIVVQPDEKIVIAGSFSVVGGQARQCVARLNRDGTVDPDFAADAAGYPPPGSVTVLALALQADGAILVGGQFATLKGQLRAGLGRVRRDGTLDESFNSNPNGVPAPVTAIVARKDGGILVGGSNFSIGTARRSLARLFADGTLDLAFSPVVLNSVTALAEQADGRVLIGGGFSAVNNQPQNQFARLLATGGLDTSLAYGAEGVIVNGQPPVMAIVTAADGRVVIGGSFANFGDVTRNGLARLVPPTLQVVAHPQNASVAPGATANFSTTVTGAAPTYQWRKNGNPIAGATNAGFTISAAQAADAGSYDVVATNNLGSVLSRAATLTIVSTARLANLSVRTALAADQSLIVGLVVSRGSAEVLVRAAGPALGQFGLAEAMMDPRLELYQDSTKLLENDNWPAVLAATAARVGAFPFANNSRDAAVLQVLSGSHSVVVGGTSPGVVLVEAYDASAGQGGRLVNVSARNWVGRDAAVLISGFSVSGTGTMRVLIRAVGPTLGGPPFGVPGVLADPKLEVFNAGGAKIIENDNWESGLAATFASAGAFPLAPDSKDAGLVVVLSGGQSYTIQVKGADGGTGIALAEVFELP